MKLRYSPTSPFVRKVMVAAIELVLDDRIERLPADIRAPDADFLDANPLGKVPVLTCDDGLILFDSRVICEYLDSIAAPPRLFPPSGAERFRVLRLMALADGILDAAILRRLETWRPAAEQSPTWIERQKEKVLRGLDSLEREVPSFGVPLSIGQIAVGCCLGTLDFRFPDEDWRIGRPMLSDWYAQFNTRPSMQATVPREPVGA